MDSVKRSGIQGQRPFIYSFQIALKAELSQETRKADILKKKVDTTIKMDYILSLKTKKF